MKRLFAGFALLSLLFIATPVQAVHVSGYYRSNGTYVQSYERTAPDGNPYNNYSYPGNYNPNTGQVTGGNSSTYLENYYGGSSYTSSYTAPTTPTCPSNSYYDGVSSCTCNSGYVSNGTSCILSETYTTLSNNLACSNTNGVHSFWNGTKADSGLLNCGCEIGYAWDSNAKLCTISSSTLAPGLTEAQVQAILSLLVSFGADQSVINNVDKSLHQ